MAHDLTWADAWFLGAGSQQLVQPLRITLVPLNDHAIFERSHFLSTLLLGANSSMSFREERSPSALSRVLTAQLEELQVPVHLMSSAV